MIPRRFLATAPSGVVVGNARAPLVFHDRTGSGHLLLHGHGSAGLLAGVAFLAALLPRAGSAVGERHQ